MRRGKEVDEEREDVKGEDEGDRPLEAGGDVFSFFEVGDAEDDGEDDFDEDKDEFDPEGESENAVLTEILVLFKQAFKVGRERRTYS